MSIEFRLSPGLFRDLQECLSHGAAVEQGCFLLCSEAEANGKTILIANEILRLGRDDFAVQKHNQLSFTPAAMLRATRAAQAKNSGLCFVHTHPMSTGWVDFSRADDLGNVRTFEFINRMLPDKINSALVFGGDMATVSGRVYSTPHDWERIDSVVVAGAPYLLKTTMQARRPQGHVTATFERQALLLGRDGQQMLSGLKGVVVGLGGVGSLVAMELAHCGFRHLVLVDHDVVEESNRSRIVGARPSDVVDRVAKVAVAKRYLGDSMPECEVTAYQCRVEDPLVREALKAADFIVVATDGAKSRAYVNEICHQFYVPVLDLGVEFVAPGGRLANEVGKVNLMLPGSACLWCIGHVTAKLVADEELPDDEVRKRAAEGYVRDTHVPQPSMMPFNGEVASRGVQLLIRQFTGLAPIDEGTFEIRSFLGLNGRRPVGLAAKRDSSDCLFCSPRGGVLGAGDSAEPVIAVLEPRVGGCHG